jgi:hypothetical protein
MGTQENKAVVSRWMNEVLAKANVDAAAGTARVLPDRVDPQQVQKFGDEHGIPRDELISRMGGSP